MDYYQKINLKEQGQNSFKVIIILNDQVAFPQSDF